MSRTLKTALDFVLFQIGWFACVVGSAERDEWIGPSVTAVFLAVHLALFESGHRVREAVSILLLGLCGCALDVGALALGLIDYAGEPDLLGLPPSIPALWLLFAMLLNSALRWLHGRIALAVVLAAIGGPLTYLAGERLGAVTIGDSRAVALVAIALVWAVYLPVALALARRTVRLPAAGTAT